MPRQSMPSYRLHKPSGQARTIINGRHIYLGKFNSPDSRQKYARLLAETAQPAESAERSCRDDQLDVGVVVRLCNGEPQQTSPRYWGSLF